MSGAVGATLLNMRYRHDVVVTEATIPPHRNKLDDVVASDAIAAFGPATLLIVVSWVIGLNPSGDTAATARVAIGFLAIAATAIYL